MTLYLVGTAHLDPKGAERIERILNKYEPDIIAVEMSQSAVPNILDPTSPDSVAKATKMIDEKLAKYTITPPLGDDDISALRAFNLEMRLITGFEFRCSRAYATEHAIPLIYADRWFDLHPAPIQALIEEFSSNDATTFNNPELREKTLAFVRDPQYRKEMQAMFDALTTPEDLGLVRQMNEERLTQLPKESSEHIFLNPRREISMADAVRDAATQGKRAISITGAMHVPYLYGVLRDLSPRVIDVRTANDETNAFLRGLSNL